MFLDDAKSPNFYATNLAVKQVAAPAEGALATERAQTAQIGQMLLFFLTLLLSGMLMSQLIEEKSNKIVEVICRCSADRRDVRRQAVRDACFVDRRHRRVDQCRRASDPDGQAWRGADAVAARCRLARISCPRDPLFRDELLAARRGGVPDIGAQASTAREVQTLSMPVTFGQVLLFGFAATAIGAPDSAKAIGAAVFPLSSPMVMWRALPKSPSCGRTFWRSRASLVGGIILRIVGATVPQDRPEIRTAPAIVEARPLLADRLARHIGQRGHQCLVRERPVTDPRYPGFCPDSFLGRARKRQSRSAAAAPRARPARFGPDQQAWNEEAACAGVGESLAALDHLVDQSVVIGLRFSNRSVRALMKKRGPTAARMAAIRRACRSSG